MKKIVASLIIIMLISITGYTQTPEKTNSAPEESVSEGGKTETRTISTAPKPGPITKKLSSAELEKIKAGETILRSSTDEEMESGSGYAIGLIMATPGQIWDTILDYDRYVEFQPRVIYCKKTLHENNRIYADFKLDMDVTEVKYSIIHTLHPSENRLTWVLDDSKPADYVTHTIGYFQLEQLAEGGTLLEYSVEVDLEIKIPGVGWIVRKLTRYLTHKDLPDVIENLKKRVDSGNTWRKK